MTTFVIEDVQMLELSKESYNRVIEKSVKRDLLNRINFFRQFRIFQHTAMGKLEQLLHHSELLNCNRGRIMYKMGQKAEGIYLIKEGSFEISKPANIGHLNKTNLQNANIDPIAKIQLKK